MCERGVPPGGGLLFLCSKCLIHIIMFKDNLIESGFMDMGLVDFNYDENFHEMYVEGNCEGAVL